MLPSTIRLCMCHDQILPIYCYFSTLLGQNYLNKPNICKTFNFPERIIWLSIINILNYKICVREVFFPLTVCNNDMFEHIYL